MFEAFGPLKEGFSKHDSMGELSRLNRTMHSSAFFSVFGTCPELTDFEIRSVIGLARKSRTAPMLAQKRSKTRPKRSETSKNRFSCPRIFEIIRKVVQKVRNQPIN